MKMERITCKSLKPSVVATGVSGGGYIHIKPSSTYALIGTQDFLDEYILNPNSETKSVSYDALSLFFRDKAFWLNEGEKIYGAGYYNGYDKTENPIVYSVVYLDTPVTVTSQPQASPINLSGTIQLNQQ